MSTIELPETNKIFPALRILVDEWGWRHGGVAIYSSDKRIVRFTDNEYEISLTTVLSNDSPIEILAVTFSQEQPSLHELKYIVGQFLKVPRTTVPSVFETLFENAVFDAFHQLFPGCALARGSRTNLFEINYRAFDLYNSSKDVAKALHCFNRAALNKYQQSVQNYLYECEMCKESKG